MEIKTFRRSDALAIAAFCMAVVVIGVLADASSSTVRIFGISIPPLCPFRLITGFDCPACGLTRSMILAFHGRFLESYMTNLFGIPLAFFLLLQVPTQLYAVFSRKVFQPRFLLRPGLSYLLLACLLIPWTLQTIAIAFILWF